jgi:hypothetical protein
VTITLAPIPNALIISYHSQHPSSWSPYSSITIIDIQLSFRYAESTETG